MNLQRPFTVTTDLIQAEINQMATKAEKLAYLALVKDFIGSAMKLTRAVMKGMK